MEEVHAPSQHLTDADLNPVLRRRRFAPLPGEVRCECLVCSAHAFAPPAGEGTGRCGNCGSHELRPLAGAA